MDRPLKKSLREREQVHEGGGVRRNRRGYAAHERIKEVAWSYSPSVACRGRKGNLPLISLLVSDDLALLKKCANFFTPKALKRRE
jgi:hypothetical protein